MANPPTGSDRNDNRAMLPWAVGGVALVAMIVFFFVG